MWERYYFRCCLQHVTLIPQIVKYTADHILVLDGIPDGLNVRQTLLLSALLVAASAVLSGVFNYLSKMCLAKAQRISEAHP